MQRNQSGSGKKKKAPSKEKKNQKQNKRKLVEEEEEDTQDDEERVDDIDTQDDQKSDDSIEDEENDDLDEEEEEEQYEVEKILAVKIKDGELKYQVRWHDWEDPKYDTWETERCFTGPCVGTEAEVIFNNFKEANKTKIAKLQKTMEDQNKTKKVKKAPRKRGSWDYEEQIEAPAGELHPRELNADDTFYGQKATDALKKRELKKLFDPSHKNTKTELYLATNTDPTEKLTRSRTKALIGIETREETESPTTSRINSKRVSVERQQQEDIPSDGRMTPQSTTPSTNEKRKKRGRPSNAELAARALAAGVTVDSPAKTAPKSKSKGKKSTEETVDDVGDGIVSSTDDVPTTSRQPDRRSNKKLEPKRPMKEKRREKTQEELIQAFLNAEDDDEEDDYSDDEDPSESEGRVSRGRSHSRPMSSSSVHDYDSSSPGYRRSNRDASDEEENAEIDEDEEERERRSPSISDEDEEEEEEVLSSSPPRARTVPWAIALRRYGEDDRPTDGRVRTDEELGIEKVDLSNIDNLPVEEQHRLIKKELDNNLRRSLANRSRSPEFLRHIRQPPRQNMEELRRDLIDQELRIQRDEAIEAGQMSQEEFEDAILSGSLPNVLFAFSRCDKNEGAYMDVGIKRSGYYSVQQDADGNSLAHKIAKNHTCTPGQHEWCAVLEKLLYCNSKRESPLLESIVFLLNDNQRLPIHEAVATNKDCFVGLLLKFASPVNARDSDGKTPLEIAYENGNIKIVEKLLKGGAEYTKVKKDADAKKTRGATEKQMQEIIAAHHEWLNAFLYQIRRRHYSASVREVRVQSLPMVQSLTDGPVLDFTFDFYPDHQPPIGALALFLHYTCDVMGEDFGRCFGQIYIAQAPLVNDKPCVPADIEVYGNVSIFYIDPEIGRNKLRVILKDEVIHRTIRLVCQTVYIDRVPIPAASSMYHPEPMIELEKTPNVGPMM